MHIEILHTEDETRSTVLHVPGDTVEEAVHALCAARGWQVLGQYPGGGAPVFAVLNQEEYARAAPGAPPVASYLEEVLNGDEGDFGGLYQLFEGDVTDFSG